MSSPILRCAESTDLPRLLPLVEAYYAFEGMRYAAEVQGEGLRQLLGNPSVGTVWLAEGPEGLLGYLVATWGFDLEWGGRQVTVTELFVAEGGRARGVGTALLEALGEALAKAGIGTVELQVATGNIAARGFSAFR